MMPSDQPRITRLQVAVAFVLAAVVVGGLMLLKGWMRS